MKARMQVREVKEGGWCVYDTLSAKVCDGVYSNREDARKVANGINRQKGEPWSPDDPHTHYRCFTDLYKFELKD